MNTPPHFEVRLLALIVGLYFAVLGAVVCDSLKRIADDLHKRPVCACPSPHK